MNFKYEPYLAVVRGMFNIECPCSRKEKNDGIPAFRWVHNPIVPNDFVPLAILKEAEGKTMQSFPEGDQYHNNCDCYGLSMYTDIKFARTAWKNVPPHRKKALGYTHVSKGTILPTDGVLTDIRGGHFDLHEYGNQEENNIIQKFKDTQEL